MTVKKIDYVPSNLPEFERCKPNFEEIEGWKTLTGVKDTQALPKEMKNYIKYIESYTGVKVYILSIGADREQTIVFKNPFKG